MGVVTQMCYIAGLRQLAQALPGYQDELEPEALVRLLRKAHPNMRFAKLDEFGRDVTPDTSMDLSELL